MTTWLRCEKRISTLYARPGFWGRAADCPFLGGRCEGIPGSHSRRCGLQENVRIKDGYQNLRRVETGRSCCVSTRWETARCVRVANSRGEMGLAARWRPSGEQGSIQKIDPKDQNFQLEIPTRTEVNESGGSLLLGRRLPFVAFWRPPWWDEGLVRH
jgi:hypothetical protein